MKLVQLLGVITVLAGLCFSGEVYAMGSKDQTQVDGAITYSTSNMRRVKEVVISSDGNMRISIDGRDGAKTQQVKISAEEYALLKKITESPDFKNLKMQYVNSTVEDGFSIRVSANGKTVVVENQEVPPALKKLVDSIEALGAKYAEKI